MTLESLQNLLLLLACLVYAPIRGSARCPVDSPKRVIIIQMAHLGDMVCTTPMFRAVKQSYPQTRIFVVGNTINKEILNGNPDVDGYIVWNKKVLEMIRTVRTLRCDFGVVTGPNFTGMAVLFLAGIRSIAAPRVEGAKIPLETKPYHILRRWVQLVPHVLGSYAPREYLKLLEPIGIKSTDTRKYVFYTREALESVIEKLRNSIIGTRKFTIIAPGAGHPAKRWPGQRFAAVAEYITTHYMPVVVIGGPKDLQDVEVMMGAVSHPDVVDFSGGQPSIDELKALVSRASLFVSVDTGPLYIAEAFGVPTIDIVGPTSETVQPPIGPKNLVIVPERKNPTMTMFHTRVIDVLETKRQAEATTVEEVTAAVDTLMAHIS